jgi:predicted flap endonuclease-1-like 5' DNA nuclease
LIAWLIEWVIDWLYWRSKLKSLTSEWQATTTVKERLQDEVLALQGDLQQREADLDAIRASLATTNAELVTLRERELDLSNSHAALAADLDQTRSAFDDTQAQLAGAFGENERLRNELSGVYLLAQDRDAELTTLRGQFVDAQSQLDGVHGENERLRSELSSIHLLVQDRDAELNAVRGQSADTQAQLDGSFGENEHLRGELSGVYILAQDRDTELNAVCSQSAETQSQLNGALGELERLRGELSGVYTLVQDRDTELIDVRGQSAETQSQLDGAHGELERLRGELSGVYTLVQDRDTELIDVRGQLAGALDENERLRGEFTRAVQQTQAREADVINLQTAFTSDLERLRAELAATKKENQDLYDRLAKLEAELEQATRVSDPFFKIKGIGPVYQRRLRESGVFTFSELAQLSVERLHEIIQPEDWQQLDFDNWLHEASIFAQGGSIKRERRTRRRRVFNSARDRLQRIAGISADYEQRLWAAGILTFDQLSHRQVADIQRSLDLDDSAIDVKSWIDEAARLARLRAELVEYSFEADDPRRTITTIVDEEEGDPLTEIYGIGPGYESRLYDAGIRTFDALAELSSEQVREIIGIDASQEVADEYARST